MRLVSCGISLDVMDGRLKQTTVHLAAFSGNALVLDWVLQAGASIDKQVSTLYFLYYTPSSFLNIYFIAVNFRNILLFTKSVDVENWKLPKIVNIFSTGSIYELLHFAL
jgi:hypothetical protein